MINAPKGLISFILWGSYKKGNIKKGFKMNKINELKELLRLLNSDNKKPEQNNDHPFEIGENYFIRTVTMNHTGKLVAVYEKELVLESAAWIADSKRFSDFLLKGWKHHSGVEIEPFSKKVIIGRGAIIDMTIIDDELPTKQQ